MTLAMASQLEVADYLDELRGFLGSVWRLTICGNPRQRELLSSEDVSQV